jgi:uncharacterized lipoprotein YmbA
MAWRLAFCAAGVMLMATLTACSTSPQPRYYALDSTASPDGLPAAPGTVAVGPVTIPASVDQPQFVTQAGQNRLDVNEFNRWAAPLNDNIAHVVAQNLRVLLATPEVAAGPLPNFAPDYVVAIEVLRFQSVRGQSTLLDAVWTVHSFSKTTTRFGHTTTRETVPDDSFAAMAAAHSRALTKLSEDIAAAIRADAGSRT